MISMAAAGAVLVLHFSLLSQAKARDGVSQQWLLINYYGLNLQVDTFTAER
jgi:hypothetical protein